MSIKRICWDACTWISLIQKEKTTNPDGTLKEDRYASCRPIIDLAVRGTIEIAVSGLCLAEVVRSSASGTTSKDAVAAYFEGDHILIVPVDRLVGTRARDLIYSQSEKKTEHTPKPADAVHIATALISNADELHTFDDKLIGLTGKLVKDDGTLLRICRPSESGPSTDMLDLANGKNG
jgi:predicted nucleic acid-binding protein